MNGWTRVGAAMIFRILLLGFALCLGGVSAVMAEEKASGYLDAIEDMPLMEGLHETGEGGIVFDKPNGRIVRSIAEGKVPARDVRKFYIDSLPQLGWVRHEKLELIGDLLVFRRETERLEIQTVPKNDGMTEVRFSIEPD
jgi:hypothetical protein